MKAHLTKVSVALLSAVFVLACQDQAPVGPDGLVPQFGVVCSEGRIHPKCPGGAGGGGGGGGVKGTVTLGPSGGMATSVALQLPGGIDATKIGLNTNTHAGEITMNFKEDTDDPGEVDTDDQVCTDYTGARGRRDEPVEPEVRKYLKSQLNTAVARGGAFFLKIDLTGLMEVGDEWTVDQHLLSVEYDGTLKGQIGYTSIRFGWVDDATVEWVSHTETQDEFEFTGGILVAAGGVGGKNGKRGRRAIACSSPVGGNPVRVTVVPI